MKNQIFWSKQGVFYRIINIFLQNLLILPVSALLSFLISLLFKSFIDIDSVLIIKIVFIILNIIWVIRNSIVKVENNAVIVRSLAGTKQIIEIDNITDLRVISYKELRNIVLNTKGVNPLITNCAVLLIPMGDFIAFKNKFGRTVTIGVWNTSGLYSLLREKSLQNLTGDEFPLTEKTTSVKTSGNSRGRWFHCFLKMPFKHHIVTYFKCFFATIVFPLFFSLFIPFLFKLADVSLNPVIWVLLFVIISVIKYLEIIRVMVDEGLKVIRLNLFYDSNKNVIKFDNISDLKMSVQNSEIEKVKKDKDKFVICTPYDKNNENEIIGFSLPNNIFVFLSVTESQDLYKTLEKAMKEKTD